MALSTLPSVVCCLLPTPADLLVERSSSINAKLLKRRQHIEELNRVQGLLVKLQVRHSGHWGKLHCRSRVPSSKHTVLCCAMLLQCCMW